MDSNLGVRKLVVSTSKELVKEGLLIATGGNLSVRIPNRLEFAVTPTNTDYLKMTEEDICILDFNLNSVFGSLRPSVESGMHAAIYQARPDVHAIIHTHQVYSSTLALVNLSIPPLFDEQVRFLGRKVKVIPYAPSGTSMLRNTIARHVKDRNNAYLMQNHGALVLGYDIHRAVLNVHLLEKCALSYLLALNTGKSSKKIPYLVREIAFQKLKKDQEKVMKNSH
jgi:L-ribulose-5-phosphate 4-epimerase